MGKRFAVLVATMMFVLLVVATTAPAMTYDQAVEKLVKDGYPQRLETYLTSQGTSPIGFSLAGTSADNNRSRYLAKEMRKLGMRSVRLEPVSVDVQEFKGASVTVGATVLTASTFGGVAAAPAGGITAEVVYVHGGTAADFEAAGDVSGKIVLIDEMLGSYWMNWPWTEAALNGAAGIIYGGFAGDDSYYADPAALASFDAEYRYALAPAIYISQNDADWLKAEMEQAPVTATLTLDQDYTLARNGGVGYNVVGTLPGSSKGAGRIVVTAHKDSYFRAGVDDLGGVVSAMLMAKAMKLSGYETKRDVTLLFTTGEEYGRINSYYDWCIGAWDLITQRHPGWAGSTAALLSLDGPGMKDAPLKMYVSPDVSRMAEDLVAKYPTLVPNGHIMLDTNCWNDAWTFNAAGVPGINFRERTADYQSNWYHTQFDEAALMDWDSLARFDKFLLRTLRKFDRGVLPYNLLDRADHLAAAVNADELKAAGADAAKADRIAAAVAEFQARAAAYQARSAKFKVGAVNRINKQLLAIEKRINKSFTGLDAWDSTVYPHAQVLYDLQQLGAALAALEDPVSEAAALDALSEVGYTAAGLDFSYENYQMQVAMKQPGWWGGLFWGAQGHLSPLPDVMPAMDKIASGRYGAARASLGAIVTSEVDELNDRLDGMSATLDWVNARLPQVR
jgi:Iap family predicted aminopeptidase